MRRTRVAVLVAVAAALCVGPSTAWAKFGIGFHYNLDFSVGMKEKRGEELSVLKDSVLLPASAPALIRAVVPGFAGSDLPILIDRTNPGVSGSNVMKRSPVAFGAKLYVDVIPILDAIEVSGDLGLWEYLGTVRYFNVSKLATVSWAGLPADRAAATDTMRNRLYDPIEVTLKSAGKNFLGLDQTPYFKLALDLTIRKNIIAFPKPLKTLKIYAGGGFSVAFASPAISAGLVDDAIGDNVVGMTPAQFAAYMQTDAAKDIIDEIIGRLFTPHFGAHIIVGTMVKVPVIPLGVYVDGKLMIPFGKLDKDAGVSGIGFLLNAGIALAF